ncbi:CLUMA_CG009391, isoform A [Clunio marinus]|uniref:CLUMA_CG009391, isoform A n=1 Tax=Clunio marinus TaxID=568069 RepID=A0A1J1I6Y4_9DIPT|nr:CLUMA_CG009391, isoform A [Clunio marinus]
MSQSFDLQERYILDLPDEMLLHIFSYLNISSSRKHVSRVCRKFYELMCVVRRDSEFPLELSYSKICDKKIRRSIVYSSREFEELTIYYRHDQESINRKHEIKIEYIEDVMLNFGRRIKKFGLSNFELFESQLRKILDCIPNVEFLGLNKVKVNIEPNENISELNLCKLKKLEIRNGSNCFNILNRLPKDTIREAIIMSHDVDIGLQKFFNKQTNIQMLEIDKNNQLKFDHLKLEYLKLNSKFINLPLNLRQQQKLRYIDFSNYLIDDEILTTICKMTNLEVVKMCVNLGMPCYVFESLKYLTQLKELQLKSDEIHKCNHLLELSRMRLKIEKLTLLFEKEKIPPEFFIQLSQNFRKLKQIIISNRSIIIINTILEHFPNLESIAVDFYSDEPEEILVISENLKHEKLKEIIATSHCEEKNTNSLLTLLNACPNLERIMLFNLAEDLQQIINNHPKLTELSLRFEDFTFFDEIKEKVHAISTAAKRLKYVNLNGLSRCTEFLERGSSIEGLFTDVFEDEFDDIMFFVHISSATEAETEIMMKKKRNSSELCCEELRS